MNNQDTGSTDNRLYRESDPPAGRMGAASADSGFESAQTSPSPVSPPASASAAAPPFGAGHVQKSTTERIGAKQVTIEGLQDGYRITVRTDSEQLAKDRKAA